MKISKAAMVFLGFQMVLLPCKAEDRPQIQFEQTNFDFGVLIQGSTSQTLVHFRNTGSSPLTIQGVDTSCGCTVAVPSEHVVQPGQEGTIQVNFNSAGKFGDIQRSLTVHTDDPSHPTTLLSLSGLVTNNHPVLSGGENMFQGSCRACHADRGQGRRGENLYAADCAMCHEHPTMTSLSKARPAQELSRFSGWRLRKGIAKGRKGTSMPAFHKSRGGPLDSEDVKSLVRYLQGIKK